MHQRLRPSAFSLVELLSVIALISIVAGITVSSVGFSSSVDLTADGNTISDTVAEARQNSIAQDAYTAVVVQTGGAAPYTTYCLMQLQRDPATGNFASSSWQQLTTWRHLGNGVVFDPTPTSNGSGCDNFLKANTSGPLVGPTPSLSYQGQPVSVGSVIYQGFRPDGTMTLNNPLRLRLVRGTWNSASNAVSYRGGTTPTDYYDVLFLQNAGQTKILRP